MKHLRILLFIVGAAIVLLAFSQDLSLEGCSRKSQKTQVRVTTEEGTYYKTDSPRAYSEMAYDDAKRSIQHIGDEAEQAKEDILGHGKNARDDLLKHGKAIGSEAVNGTVRTTKNAAKSYTGFLGNLIENVKNDWHNFLLAIGYSEEDINNNSSNKRNIPDYDSMGNESHKKIYDAWEGRNTSSKTQK